MNLIDNHPHYSCDNQLFVLKPVSQSIFDFLQDFKNEFGNNTRLRNHVDYNDQSNTFVYEYFKTNLFTLVSNYPALPIKARKAILKEVGLALNDMHTKKWIHLGKTPHTNPLYPPQEPPS